MVRRRHTCRVLWSGALVATTLSLSKERSAADPAPIHSTIKWKCGSTSTGKWNWGSTGSSPNNLRSTQEQIILQLCGLFFRLGSACTICLATFFLLTCWGRPYMIQMLFVNLLLAAATRCQDHGVSDLKFSVVKRKYQLLENSILEICSNIILL